MAVVICTIELWIPEAQSLKEKRRTVKKGIERIRSRTGASVAETGMQNSWQRAELGVAIVSGNRRVLEGQVERIRRILDEIDECETTGFDVEYI